MITEEIKAELFKLQDIKYRDFQSGLTPALEKESFIGIRTPALRKYAKEVSKRAHVEDFLQDLPHNYFDENQLHAFIISEIKDFDSCMVHVEKFLPYVDNWATCDQMNPKVFKKHHDKLLEYVNKWVRSEHTYTVRFGIKVLMDHFLNEDFKKEYIDMVADVRSEEYYINMMIAWYFATALAKQYDATISYIENPCLEKWTHNKAIQKAIESYRISPGQKEYLRALKIK